MADLDPKDTLLTFFIRYIRDNIAAPLPGRIIDVSDYSSQQVVDVVIDISRKYVDGSIVRNEGVVLYKLPYINIGAGGGSLTFPVKVGDNVLIIPCMRDMDAWKASQGDSEVAPNTPRHYNFQDSVVIGGIGTILSNDNPSSESVELNLGGSTIRLNPDNTLEIESSSKVSIRASEIDANGATITASGNVITSSGADVDLMKAKINELIGSYTTHGSGAPNHPGAAVLPLV